MLDFSRNNPFKSPLNVAQCEEVERNISSIELQPSEACEFGSLRYFALCGFCGILSCGSTHTFVVPLDLVKTRLQVDQAKYKNFFHGFKVTVAEEGFRGLAKGWAPTAIGYSAQVSWQLVQIDVTNLSFKIIYVRVSSSSAFMRSSKSSTLKSWETKMLSCFAQVYS